MSMVKRISCIVVRTAPLGKSNDTLRQARHLNNKHHKISGAAVNIRARHNVNSVTYASRLGIAGMSIDDSPTGQILDCYA